jgi:signal transduction histidine kinase
LGEFLPTFCRFADWASSQQVFSVTTGESSSQSNTSRELASTLINRLLRRKRAEWTLNSGSFSPVENSDVPTAELQKEISRLRDQIREIEASAEVAMPASGRLPRSWRHRAPTALRYTLAVLFVASAWLTTVTLKDSLRATYFQTPFFFCAIVLSSWFGGLGSGICSTLLSMILLEVFFPQPLYSPGFSANDLPRFAVFFAAGAFISWLGGRQRSDEEALLRAREELEAKVRARTIDLQAANEKLMAEVEERIRQKIRAEVRTESVMRANQTIPASLSSLGDTNNLDRLLGDVLSVIVEYLGEEGGGVWLYDVERDRLRLQVVFEDGEIKAAHESSHPDATLTDGEVRAIKKEGGPSPLTLFKNNAAAIFRSNDLATRPELAPYRAYFTSRGVRSLVGIPLIAADDFLGMISVRSRLDESLSADQVAFVQAIAIHASLALKMSRLANVARLAVVAEERREAIVRSKEALGRIATAGRATLQRLAAQPDLTSFLHHVLAVSVEQFRAAGTSVWLGDLSTGICSQCISYRNGDPQPTTAPGYKFHFDPANPIGADALRLLQGRTIVHRAADFATLPSDGMNQTETPEPGIQTLIRIPLFFGTEARGIFTLKFSTERMLSAEEDGLAQTLANQVVLALELTKLSEKAKAAALADERNRMAADVHDTLAQAFAATLLHLRSMEMTDAPTELQSHWKFAQATAAEGLSAARRAMNAIRTATPADSRPLAERLMERVRQVAARTRASAKVRFQLQGKVSVLPWAVEDELERLVSEALFNAERHAAAREVAVKLDYLSDGGLRVRVTDDGRGFDQDEPHGAGLGLRSMHDRAERIGASFTLITESGRGTEIVVLWTANPTHAGPQTNEPQNQS